MKEIIQKFIDKYLGIGGVDFDGAYGKQCVDLFRAFHRDIVKKPQPRSVVGAKDFWSNYETDNNLKNNYTKIPNTPDYVPDAGDVIIWSNGKYGHIAIATGEGDTKYFMSLDQNWKGKRQIAIVKHTYGYVYGCLRANILSTQETMPDNALQECLNQHKKLVDEAIEKDKEIENLVSERNNALNSLKAESEAHKATKREFRGFIDQLADILGSVHSRESVVKFVTENSNAIDDRDKYKDLYEREVKARKEDYLKHQDEVKELKKQLDDLKAQNDRLASKLANLGLQITNKLDEVDEAKDKIEKAENKPSGKSLWQVIKDFLSSFIQIKE